MRKILLSILLFLGSLQAFSQTDNYGTEFWTGFMSNLASSSELRLFIAARNTTDVTISVPLLSYSQKVNVLKDSVVIVKIPNSVGQISSSEVIEKTGVHIVSDYPVAITAMNISPATTDATVVFPLKNVPSNATYITGHPGKVSNMAGNEFLIVSTENGAKVEIIPTAKTLKGKTAFVPFTITLDAGEVYQVQADNKAIMDGSSVRSTNGKRIVVYTGDKCSAFPCGACDHQVEQVFPNQLLDTAYYVLPFFGHKKGYTVKVVSIDTTIWIKVNKKAYRIGKKDSALVIDVPGGDSVLHISGPRKFSCFQFMKGPGCNGYVTSGWGDPSVLQILSAKYMGQKSTFNAVNSTNLKDHFVSILIHTSSKNDVYLDGSKIAPNEFIPVIDNPDFSFARLKITLGVHTILCNKIGHLAYCYGIGNYESYIYTAGFSLPNFEIDIKDSVLNYDCKSNKVSMRFEAKLEGAIKEYRWDFGDGSSSDTSKIVVHKYNVGEDFTIKLWAIGFNNKKDSIVKKYKFQWPEFNPVFDKILCDNTYLFEEKNPFFKNFKWHDNSTSNSYSASKTEKIWVTATDTSGYCKFGDTARVSKVEVFSKIFVDTLSNCYLNNLFKFSDSSGVKSDLINYKVWNFPGGITRYDTSNFYHHFRTAGKLMVYLDIYPKNAPCKARVEIPVTVNWNTDIDAIVLKNEYCNGEIAGIQDNSYNCCQKVKKYYWEFDDGTKLKSDSGKLSTRVFYDFKKETGIKNYKFITETEQGCRDTLKAGIIVWPAAPAKFDMGTDTVKCLALSRWTFTHYTDESLTGPYSLYWDFGNGKTGTSDQYKNFRYTDTGTYKISLKTKTALGCQDSGFKYLKVIGNAAPEFIINDSVQCFTNNSFKITDKSKGFGLKYIWNFGNGNTSFVANPADEHYLFPGIYKIKLKLVSNFPGCFDDSVVHSVYVLKQPKANFTVDDSVYCLTNNLVKPKDNSVYYNGKGRVYWNYNNLIDSNQLPLAIYFPDTGSYLIKLHVKDSMGCTDSSSGFVNIKPEPVVKLSINDSVQCFGENTFTFTTPDNPIVKHLVWKLNSVAIDSDILQKTIFNLSPSGFHTISLLGVTAFGCRDSFSKKIEVLPQFKVDFSVNKDTQCFSSHSVNLTDRSLPPADAVKKQSYSEGITTLGLTGNITGYKFSSPGDKRIVFYVETENRCKDSIMHAVYLSPDPVASFVSDSVCLGEAVSLTALQISGPPLLKWAWNMGDGSKYDFIPFNFTSHLYKNAGTYYPHVSFTDKLGCSGSYAGNPVVVYPLPNPAFTVKILSSDVQYSYVKLLPDNLGYLSYHWTFPDGSSNDKDSPAVNLSRFFKDRILLKVISINGCKDTGSKYLYIFPPLNNLFIENAFSPNNDQLNDVFRPGNIDGAVDFKLTIYDRWGEILFRTNNPETGWDGTYKAREVQSGVYIYTLEFKYADGNRYTAKGNVTLIR